MKVPAFCPNPECKNHLPENIPKHGKSWYSKSGFYRSLKSKEPVQRFICRDCGKQFSINTFSLNYYAKLELNYIRIMQFLSSGMSIRAMARHFKCAPGTVNRKIGNLARQCSVFMSFIIENLKLNEDFVADGFESFAVSQYFPNNFNILVGKDSQFVYHFDYVQLHRKGRMTEYQKKRAAKMKKLWPTIRDNEAIAFFEIKQKIIEMARAACEDRVLKVYTDEKQVYKRCLAGVKKLTCYDNSSVRFQHLTISSRKHRGLHNELFPVNYMDREFRKDLAEHHRESTCFARNVNNSIDRMSVYIFYHNFFKPHRINIKEDKVTIHAAKAGIEKEMYSSMSAHLFTRRFFITHHNLDGNNEKVCHRAYQTPLKRQSDYLPRYALAG